MTVRQLHLYDILSSTSSEHGRFEPKEACVLPCHEELLLVPWCLNSSRKIHHPIERHHLEHQRMLRAFHGEPYLVVPCSPAILH